MKPLPTLEEASERVKAGTGFVASLTEEQRKKAFAFSEADIACKHCGRCVLVGPPCCYQSVNELWQQASREVQWLRKIQSKQAKKIEFLLDQLGISLIEVNRLQEKVNELQNQITVRAESEASQRVTKSTD